APVLRDIAAVGSGNLTALAAGLTAAVQRFQAFIAAARESGQLQSWISGGLTALSQLGQILANIGSIAGSVFGALDVSGGGFLTGIQAATGTLATFLRTAEGSQALVALAQVATTAGQVLSGVL